jgi:hypothetical protein
MGPTSGWMQDATLPAGGRVLELAESAGVLYALQAGLSDGGVGSRVSVRTDAGTWALLGEVPVNARTLRATTGALWLAGTNSALAVLAKDGGVVTSAVAAFGNRDFLALAPLSDEDAIVGGTYGLMGFASVDGGFVEHSLAASRLRLGKLCSYPTASGPVVVATSETPACPSGCLARLLERRETTRGTEWLAVDVGVGNTSGKDTLACHVECPTLGWATTSGRFLLYRTGTGSWSALDLGNTYDTNWHGVWGGPWYFVGNNASNVILRNFDGGVTASNFSAQSTSDAGRLRAVTGVERDTSFAVGSAGTVGRLGSDFTYSLTSGPATNVTMNAVSVTRFSDGGARFVAVGSGGAVWTALHSASNFTASSAPFPAADFRDVWVAPSGDSVLVGDGGAGRAHADRILRQLPQAEEGGFVVRRRGNVYPSVRRSASGHRCRWAPARAPAGWRRRRTSRS